MAPKIITQSAPVINRMSKVSSKPGMGKIQGTIHPGVKFPSRTWETRHVSQTGNQVEWCDRHRIGILGEKERTSQEERSDGSQPSSKIIKANSIGS